MYLMYGRALYLLSYVHYADILHLLHTFCAYNILNLCIHIYSRIWDHVYNKPPYVCIGFGASLFPRVAIGFSAMCGLAIT